MAGTGEWDPLVHLCSERQWRDALAAGEVRPGPAGFIHLSAPRQVHLPANRIFAGSTDLVALMVDRRVLEAPVRWEPGVPGDPEGMLFPHLYGPLPVAAVVKVKPYRPQPDGRFAPLIHTPAE
ncbi:MAG: DUF952 domain-containing protein [Mycobacterium sp.]